MNKLHNTALVLAIIGAINWGLIGFFDFNLVGAIFGGAESALSRVIYALVGLAGLTLVYTSTQGRDRMIGTTTRDTTLRTDRTDRAA